MSGKRPTIYLPIARQFLLMLAIFILLTVAVLGYSAREYMEVQTDLLNESLDSYSSQLAKTTQAAYDSYENICYTVAYSQSVQDYLTNEDSAAVYESYQDLISELENYALLNTYIVDIAVCGRDGRFAAIVGASYNYEDYALLLADARFAYRSVGTTRIIGTECHILAMPIYSLGAAENTNLGVLFLAVDVESLLSNTLSGADSGSNYEPQILFVDSSDHLLYGEEELFRLLKQSSPDPETDSVYELTDAEDPASPVYTVREYALTGIDHTLYVLIERSALTNEVILVTIRLMIGICLVLLLILLFLFFIYRTIFSSLRQLTASMKRISEGDQKLYKKGVEIKQGRIGSTEIRDISNAFNEMLRETDRLNHTVFETYTHMYELEDNNRRTEIAFLRSQINPHFLYNTLTMICGMAAEGCTDEIIDVAGALSRIFRYSIKGSDLVPLREEMEIVEAYLRIQKTRFAGRFSVEVHCTDAALECLIPRMIIQPLVENAIVHGLEKKTAPGMLTIQAGIRAGRDALPGAEENPAADTVPDADRNSSSRPDLRQDTSEILILRVSDTGIGMPKERLEAIQKELQVSASGGTGNQDTGTCAGFTAEYARMDSEYHESIGLLNVNHRMVLYYGRNYTLHISSEEGKGTDVEIRVPCHRDESSP